MNKSQLVETLAARFDGNRKAAAHALESVLDTITREVAKGEKVAITGFGSFEKRVRDARWVRNPRTGERIKAKKTAIPKFTAGADLKAVVSGAKKLPKLPKASDVAKKATELERLQIALKDNILTPEVKQNGFGGIEEARLDKAIEQIGLTYKFKGEPPKAGDVFDSSFLPPAADRKAN